MMWMEGARLCVVQEEGCKEQGTEGGVLCSQRTSKNRHREQESVNLSILGDEPRNCLRKKDPVDVCPCCELVE